jgi:hypothetical protein
MNKPLRPSTESSRVECKYEVMVEMSIPWAPDLEIYNPITLYAPQSSFWASWVPPPWVSQAKVGSSCPELAVDATTYSKEKSLGAFLIFFRGKNEFALKKPSVLLFM